MCNCSKAVSKTDCQLLKKYATDPAKRFFIYHVFDLPRGLEIAWIPNGQNPNEVATQRGFLNADGIPEWFNVKEHPCLYEESSNQNET